MILYDNYKRENGYEGGFHYSNFIIRKVTLDDNYHIKENIIVYEDNGNYDVLYAMDHLTKNIFVLLQNTYYVHNYELIRISLTTSNQYYSTDFHLHMNQIDVNYTPTNMFISNEGNILIICKSHVDSFIVVTLY